MMTKSLVNVKLVLTTRRQQTYNFKIKSLHNVHSYLAEVNAIILDGKVTNLNEKSCLKKLHLHSVFVYHLMYFFHLTLLASTYSFYLKDLPPSEIKVFQTKAGPLLTPSK